MLRIDDYWLDPICELINRGELMIIETKNTKELISLKIINSSKMITKVLDCGIIQEDCRRIRDGYRDCIGCHIWHRVKRHGDDPNMYKTKQLKNAVL